MALSDKVITGPNVTIEATAVTVGDVLICLHFLESLNILHGFN